MKLGRLQKNIQRKLTLGTAHLDSSEVVRMTKVELIYSYDLALQL